MSTCYDWTSRVKVLDRIQSLVCESELLARSIGDLPEGYAGTILKKTDVGTEPGTTFVQVSYKDTDAERAQRIANAIGETFSGQVSELSVSATPRNRSGVAGGDVARNPRVSRAPAQRRAGAGDRDCARYRAGLPARVPGLRRDPRRKRQNGGLPGCFAFGIILRSAVPTNRRVSSKLARYCLARQIQTDENVPIAGRDLYGLTTREVFGTRRFFSAGPIPSDPAGLSSPDRFARRVAVRVLVAGEMA